MTINSTTSRNAHTGNGSVSNYSYTFYIFEDSDLLVTVKNTDDEETTLVLTTDYTVNGAGELTGRSIDLVSSGQAWLTAGKLTTGYIITIRRVRPLEQETDIRNQGEYLPEVIENTFDHLLMVDQQQQDELDRSVKFPETVSSADFDPTLPAEITANYYPRVNPTGDGWVWAAGDIGDAADITFTPAGSIAATTVQAAIVELDADVQTVVNSRASPAAVVAGTAIIPSAVFNQTRFIQGSGGAVTVSANPQIAAGTIIGQRLTLVGRSDTNTVTYNNGNGLVTNGIRVLKASSTIEFLWDGTNWVEVPNDL